MKTSVLYLLVFIVEFVLSLNPQLDILPPKSPPLLSSPGMSIKRPELPSRIIVGYANWNQCDDKIIEAVQNGVNVVIWFSINLAVSATGEPEITNGPDMDCVGDVMKSIRELGLETVHLISIGGWNSPHPDTTHSAETWFNYWNNWNRNIAARPSKGFYGFDGFDWDVEGNDTPSSVYNHFTVECLDLMGRMSQLAKSSGEYLVAMAPAESYLDPNMASFDRSLLHEYEEWETLQPGFAYHGLNTYAYLLDRYGNYNESNHTPSICEDNGQDDITTAVVEKPTFDFVTVQLYEGYSHAEYATQVEKQSPVKYVTDFVKRMQIGWQIDFSKDAELNYPCSRTIALESTRLVVGLANGWAGDGKFFLMYPEEVGAAYSILEEVGEAPRGFAFWNIKDEGIASPRAPHIPVWMATGLNQFLKIRKNED